MEISKNGTLTTAEVNQVLKLTEKYQKQLMKQWLQFKAGKTLKMITIKK